MAIPVFAPGALIIKRSHPIGCVIGEDTKRGGLKEIGKQGKTAFQGVFPVK